MVAGRLAKRFPTLQVLIIEAGRNNLDDPLVRTPAFYIHHLKPDSQTANFYVSKPSPHVAGRSNTVATGGLLGGGSSINFMMYTRASASDYDDWNTQGWTFNDLKPLLLQVATMPARNNLNNFRRKLTTYNQTTPIMVMMGHFTYPTATVTTKSETTI